MVRSVRLKICYGRNSDLVKFQILPVVRHIYKVNKCNT